MFNENEEMQDEHPLEEEEMIKTNAQRSCQALLLTRNNLIQFKDCNEDYEQKALCTQAIEDCLGKKEQTLSQISEQMGSMMSKPKLE